MTIRRDWAPTVPLMLTEIIGYNDRLPATLLLWLDRNVMPVPYLIIDGYNLMHAAGIARRSYGPGDLERCRNRLIHELCESLSTDVQTRATVVFDAFTSESDQHRLQRAGHLTVLYAPRGTDADSEIERMLLKHSAPKQVVVVSSDHRLHRAADRRKARCVDSEDFWAGITACGDYPPPREQPIPNATRRPSNDPAAEYTAEDLKEWQQHVGDQLNDDAPSTNETFGDDYLSRIEKELRNGDLK